MDENQKKAQDKSSLQLDLSKASAAEVFASSGILFTQYKNCLIQCVQLSTGQPLLLLANTFQKNLREYANRVLYASLPKVQTSSFNIQSTISNITVGGSNVSNVPFLQNFLQKDSDNSYLSKADLVTICSVILTSNYCLETTQQLEKKLQEKVDESIKKNIQMTGEQDLFHHIISNAIQILVSNIESSLEPFFTAMLKINWSAIDTPIGPSAFVTNMARVLQESFPFIRENLSDARKYFTQFCLSFSDSFIPKFIINIFKCKNLSQGGAEQLLLDTHTIKKILLELPILESVVKSAPASYTKSVIKGMTKAEMILKVVLVPHHQNVESFIESYQKLLPDSDTTEFLKILDMKGVKRNETNFFLEMFRSKSIIKNTTKE